MAERISQSKFARKRKFADSDISKVLAVLRKEARKWKPPVVSLEAVHSGDPFRVLIATILSLRTRDETTAAASKKLFAEAQTPSAMASLGAGRIESLIYPVGFYRTKAERIVKICKRLEDEYGGKVPDTVEGLLGFEGVGRKTANLVITVGYGKPGICVDIHVHRISNRLGYVSTKDPLRTEEALRAKLPEKHWIEYNFLMVAFGQTLCKPVSPMCGKCPVGGFCMRAGVETSR